MKRFTPVLTVFFVMVFFLTTLHAQRIKVQGNKFLVGDSPIFMLGANTPWNNWNEFGSNFNSSWWNTHFQSLHNSGCNCTRVWISCDGANTSPGIDATGAVSSPTTQFWNHVDQLFQIAEINKIYLMIALISFDHTKTGNPNANSWRAMYKSAQNRQSFIDNYVTPFLEKFGNNPYFWAIDVGNELDWVHENDSVPIENVFDLAARVANAAHAKSEVLVTLGTGAGPKYLSPTYGTNRYSDVELQKLQPGAYLDFYDDHFYDWMIEWFSSPFDNSPATWQIDEKPCVIGEYAAVGHGAGYNPAECLQKAADLGWLGVMPWTSNGIDANGSTSDFGNAFKTWSDAHSTLVFPPLEENPGPFTLTVTPPQGGTITVTPPTGPYTRGTEVTLTAIPVEGKAFVRWTGDASGTPESIVLTMTRDMTVSALFATAGEFIKNGTFDDGATAWNLGQYEGGTATASIIDNSYKISISNGGTELWHVQLLQAGLSLEAGQAYLLSFDASAESVRSVFVAVGEAEGTYAKYLEQTVDLPTETKHFSFEFTPTASTSNARVEFNIGLETIGITLDNISLRYAGSSVITTRNNRMLQPHPAVVYQSETGYLHLSSSAEKMSVDGFLPNGKRIFTWNGTGMDGRISIPLSGNVPRMLIVRITADGTTRSMHKILCGR